MCKDQGIKQGSLEDAIGYPLRTRCPFRTSQHLHILYESSPLFEDFMSFHKTLKDFLI